MNCEHRKEKQTLSSWFGSIPRFGITEGVRCKDCGKYVAIAKWEETKPLCFDIVFTDIVPTTEYPGKKMSILNTTEGNHK